MNESFKKLLSKCFLYTLLGICFFALITLIGCFVAGDTNVFEWNYNGRVVITILSIALTVGVIVYKEG